MLVYHDFFKTRVPDLFICNDNLGFEISQGGIRRGCSTNIKKYFLQDFAIATVPSLHTKKDCYQATTNDDYCSATPLTFLAFVVKEIVSKKGIR